MLNKMKAFGLNSYEAKLWMALLSRGVSTAGELSDIANVPRSRSYDVLESLEKKGFIMMKLGKPIKYVAVKPHEVIERVKKRIESEAQTQAMMIDKIKESEVLEELRMLHSKGIQTVEPGDLTSSIKGRTNIYNHLSSSIKNAESKVLIMTSAEELGRIYDNLKRALSKAKRNGISIRIAAPIDDEHAVIVRRLSEFAEVRPINDLKSRFCIVDGKEITFMLTDDSIVHSSYDVAVWASSDFFCSSMERFFDNVWKASPEVTDGVEGSVGSGAEIQN